MQNSSIATYGWGTADRESDSQIISL